MKKQAWDYRSLVAKNSNNTGGSGSGSSDGIEYTYLDFTNPKDEDSILILNVINLCCIARYEKDNEIAIAPYNLLTLYGKSQEYILKFAIDLNIKMVMDGEAQTIKENFSMNGFDLSPYSITKEQFYSLD